MACTLQAVSKATSDPHVTSAAALCIARVDVTRTAALASKVSSLDCCKGDWIGDLYHTSSPDLEPTGKEKAAQDTPGAADGLHLGKS